MKKIALPELGERIRRILKIDSVEHMDKTNGDLGQYLVQ